MENYLLQSIKNHDYLVANPEIANQLADIYSDHILNPLTQIIEEIKLNPALFMRCAPDGLYYWCIRDAIRRMERANRAGNKQLLLLRVPGGYKSFSADDILCLLGADTDDDIIETDVVAYYRADWPQKYHYLCSPGTPTSMAISSSIERVTGQSISTFSNNGELQITVNKVYPTAEDAKRAAKDTLSRIESILSKEERSCIRLLPTVRIEGDEYIAPYVDLTKYCPKEE